MCVRTRATRRPSDEPVDSLEGTKSHGDRTILFDVFHENAIEEDLVPAIGVVGARVCVSA